MRNWKVKEKYVQGKKDLIILKWVHLRLNVFVLFISGILCLYESAIIQHEKYTSSLSVDFTVKVSKMEQTNVILLQIWHLMLFCIIQYYDVISYLKWHFEKSLIWSWNRKFLSTDRLHHLIQWLLFCLVWCHHDKHTIHCKIFFHQKLIQNLYIWLCQTTLSRI